MSKRILLDGGRAAQRSVQSVSGGKTSFSLAGMAQRLSESRWPAPLLLCAILIAAAIGVRSLITSYGTEERKYTHEVFPVVSARRGFTEPLETENRVRKLNGRPLIDVPRERRHPTAEDKAKLSTLEQSLHPSADP